MTDKAKELLANFEHCARAAGRGYADGPKLLEARKRLEDYIEELEHFMRAENWLAEQTARG